MALQIMVNSSSYKAGRVSLIQDDVLTNILEIQVEGQIAQQLQLKVMLNFSKSEEGKALLQKDRKGIEKALAIMMGTQDQRVLDVGATLLGNISGETDLEKALEMI